MKALALRYPPLPTHLFLAAAGIQRPLVLGCKNRLLPGNTRAIAAHVAEPIVAGIII